MSTGRFPIYLENLKGFAITAKPFLHQMHPLKIKEAAFSDSLSL